jgi:hypothetical protein
VFNGGHREDCYRYSTWQEAEDGHKKVCRELTSGLTREELEYALELIGPLLAQEIVRQDSPGPEQPQQGVDDYNGQDHDKDYIDDLADRDREWE